MNKSQEKLIQKALTDAKFKAELLKDPKAAVEKAFGVKLAPGVALKVVEDDASTVHLVLPPSPKSGQLSDKVLEGVAGGNGWPYTKPRGCDNTDASCSPLGF